MYDTALPTQRRRDIRWERSTHKHTQTEGKFYVQKFIHTMELSGLGLAIYPIMIFLADDPS